MSGVRPFVLVILDGWGCNPDAYGNAIAAARTPELDALEARWPHTQVAASGEAVGLPAGQQGNSEVGHLTIGAGRLVLQPLSRITHAIADGTSSRTPSCAPPSTGLVSAERRSTAWDWCPGGVHSHQDHAVALAELARRRGLQSLWFHAFLDGRDEPPTSAAGFVRTFIDSLERVGAGAVASVAGRYYGMDRDRRWDRVERAYDVIAGDGGATAHDAVAVHRIAVRRGHHRRVRRARVHPRRGQARAHRGRGLDHLLQLPAGPRARDEPRARRHGLRRVRAVEGAARRRPRDVHGVRARPRRPRRLSARGRRSIRSRRR